MELTKRNLLADIFRAVHNEEPTEDDLNYYEGEEEYWYEWYELPNFGKPEIVAQWNLGDGNEQGYVFKLQDRLFRKTGWYSSWDAGEMDGPLEEVESYEVVKVRYRKLTNSDF